MAARWSSEIIVTEHRDLQASAMAVDSTGTFVLLAGRRYLAIKHLDDHQSESLRKFPRQSNYEVSAAEWNPSIINKELCAVSTNQKIEIFGWNSSDLVQKHTVRAHTRVVNDLNWHNFDPNLLASCSIDTFIHLWDIRDMRRPSLSLSAIAGATQVRWNRLSGYLLATAHDGDIKLWDQRKGTTPVQYIAAHLSKIHGLDWSPLHENQLASSSQDGTVKFFDVTNPRRAEYILTTGAPVWRARFTPFGEGLVTVVVPQLRRGLNSLLLWNTVTHSTPVHTFVGHTDVVLEFEWRPQRDGCADQQLVTWSKDQSLRVWRIDPALQKLCGHDPDEDLCIDLDLEDPVIIVDEQLQKIDDTSSEPDTEKNFNREPIQPKTLQQEFSLINVNIPNVEIVKLDAENRTCTVTASASGQFIMLQVNFPASYPFNTCPVFQFCQGTTIDNAVMTKLSKSLKQTAQQRVKKNRSCLEPCLRQLVSMMEQLSVNKEVETKKDYYNLNPTFLESPTLCNPFHDAYIPFPRTSGAKFCSVSVLVCFGRPPNARRFSVKPESSTPREMSALCNQNSVLYPIGSRAGGSTSISTFYFQDRQSTYQRHSRNYKSSGKTKSAVNRKPVVTIYDASCLFFINKTLGQQYMLDGNDTVAICQHNAQIAASIGRHDLVQTWTLASISAAPLKNSLMTKNVDDEIPWPLHPNGRYMLESLITHYAKRSDIQTAAMLSCVFSRPSETYEIRSKHRASNASRLATGKWWLKPGGSPYHTIPPADAVDSWSLPIRKPNRSNSLDDLKITEEHPAEESNATDCYMLDTNNTLLYDTYKKSYAEVLYRWNFLYARAQVLKFLSTPPETHKGVEFLTDCQYCKKPVRGASCPDCTRVALNCIICHVCVRGSSSFCIACGHGGHTLHLKNWFNNNDVCPTGCGCKCLLETDSIFAS